MDGLELHAAFAAREPFPVTFPDGRQLVFPGDLDAGSVLSLLRRIGDATPPVRPQPPDPDAGVEARARYAAAMEDFAAAADRALKWKLDQMELVFGDHYADVQKRYPIATLRNFADQIWSHYMRPVQSETVDDDATEDGAGPLPSGSESS